LRWSRPKWASSIEGRHLRLSLGAGLAFGTLLAGTGETQNAVANGETRTLSIYHTHSKETASITFKRDGRYDRAGLDQLNHILRDWRTDDKISMDPALFDAVWAVYRETGSREPIHVVSAYRAPATNAMLRRRSRAVADQSQHMRGKALDFFLPDVSTEKVREVGMRLQGGGVGYYPSSFNPFVHIDVGSVRAWPRMSHDQLARLFPDGKTVHLPKDGKPLPRYEEAKAEILARGGAVAGFAVAQADDDGGNTLKSFLSKLFGGADEAEDRELVATAGKERTAAKPVLASVTGSTQESAQPSGLAWLQRLTSAEPEPQPAPNVPLPMRRPGAEDKLVALGPLPPRRPGESLALAAADGPLPQERAAMVALLQEIGRRSLSDETAARLDPGDASGSSEHPLPPQRPSAGRDKAKAMPAVSLATILSRIDTVHGANPTYASANPLWIQHASVTGALRHDQATAGAAWSGGDAPSIAGKVPQVAGKEEGRFGSVAARAPSAGVGFR
jgi:uncharacterized protein YcbK (DUF882 family)